MRLLSSFSSTESCCCSVDDDDFSRSGSMYFARSLLTVPSDTVPVTVSVFSEMRLIPRSSLPWSPQEALNRARSSATLLAITSELGRGLRTTLACSSFCTVATTIGLVARSALDGGCCGGGGCDEVGGEDGRRLGDLDLSRRCERRSSDDERRLTSCFSRRLLLFNSEPSLFEWRFGLVDRGERERRGLRVRWRLGGWRSCACFKAS